MYNKVASSDLKTTLIFLPKVKLSYIVIPHILIN